MAKKEKTPETPENNSSPIKKKLHRWRNFPPEDSDVAEFEQRVLQFEDSTIKLRMKIAGKYGVIYHCPYFTKRIPDARIKTKNG